MTLTLLYSLRDAAVRDLAWVIGSPGLLDAAHPAYAGQVVDDAWCRAQLQARTPWLSALDLEPHMLHEFIAARPTRRLGHYFESLIAFWFTHRPDAQIIASNLQVQEAGRTLGEYDLLFRDGTAAICHWEAAVKFYLQVQPLAEQRVFIGPAARDRLDLKLNRVFQRQLGLGRTPAGRAALPNGIMLDKAQAFIKGYLFYPAMQHEKSLTPNPTAAGIADTPGVSGIHLRGWWVRYPTTALPQTSPDTGWMILPRLRWLAPVRLDADASLMTNGEICAVLKQHFAASSEALQVAELQRVADCSWHECARGFVVCSTWPSIDGVEFSADQVCR